MKQLSRLLGALRSSTFGWRPWQYAVISISGLAGMLVFDGWLHSVMLAMTAWPVAAGVFAWRMASVQVAANQAADQ